MSPIGEAQDLEKYFLVERPLCKQFLVDYQGNDTRKPCCLIRYCSNQPQADTALGELLIWTSR